MELLIVTGMSGAGKSQVVNVLEDIGYYCVDNIPPQLITSFVNVMSG
ncbi:MAG: RNase adaptor protein RapZ, partial [Clostridia bacterium]|nr:RNase adaptor protein RapZ [Clostridia bacterium]